MNTKMMVKTALIASFTAITAVINIPLPFSDVPVTLQLFFPLLAGAVLGPGYGALSQIIYVLMGVMGLPVFAKGTAGLGVLLGPTGGYLIGFILAAFVVGLIVRGGRATGVRLALAMAAGIAVIYLVGVVQLAYVAKFSLPQAIMLGAAPFIMLDIIKAVVAAGVARKIGVATSARGA